MTEKSDQRTLELCGLLCDEIATPEEFAELDTLLASDDSARQVYCDFLRMHRRLEDSAFNSDIEITSTQKILPLRKPRPLLWVAAIAAVLALAAIVLSSIDHSLFPSSKSPPTAVLTRAIDIEWEHETRFQATPGEAITEQWLRFNSGIAEITFSSGATVTLQGPAKIRIDEPLYCFSKAGKLAAHCPESAYGFTVRFPGGRVVDLGTEFVLESNPDGKTDVHVLDGEVVVALTDDSEQVISEQNLREKSSVSLDPVTKAIAAITYDVTAFSPIQRDTLLRNQPLKLQFDIGHRAGAYTGTNAPGHQAGDFLNHEDKWTQVVGDQSGTLLTADGNLCPHPISIDYGHGDSAIDWDAQPVDPLGEIWNRAEGIYDTALCQDHRPWNDNLAYRVSGLPAGTYRVYALCRHMRRPDSAYDVSIGVNLDEHLPSPIAIPTLDRPLPNEWTPNQTHAVGEITLTGPADQLTVITRYADERSPVEGRAVLCGLQIVQIK
jgi:hypothetical protein